MSPNRRLLLAMVMGGASLVASGCGPTYPKCENDEHCSEKGEFCVNGLCQQCRDNSHCQGPGMECRAGKCQRRPGYCDDSVPCPGNQKCRDNQCGPECLDNSECGAGTYCADGSCVPKPECGPNADNPACPEGQECVAGRCQVQLASCSAEAVLFDFDKYNIKPGEKAKLDAVATCLSGANAAPVRIEGHCDERGTEEYNLALGERRAESSRKYLVGKGIDPNKLSTISFGEERPVDPGHSEASWKKNRRAEFVPR